MLAPCSRAGNRRKNGASSTLLLSNCVWKDGILAAEYRQAFDMLALARHAAGDAARESAAQKAGFENWLPGLDTFRTLSGGNWQVLEPMRSARDQLVASSAQVPIQPEGARLDVHGTMPQNRISFRMSWVKTKRRPEMARRSNDTGGLAVRQEAVAECDVG